jgi:tRNA nucleotidyltransferase (CCA-adding enzyme)
MLRRDHRKEKRWACRHAAPPGAARAAVRRRAVRHREDVATAALPWNDFAMARKPVSLPPDFVQADPGLGILRLAALLAEADGTLDEDTLDTMFERIEAGVLLDTAPADIWPELARGLMARSPAVAIRALRESGVLDAVLPEVAALFGVPQIAGEPGEVDLGAHLLKSLAEAARRDAPLAVRFALLVMNVGKSDSPREHLPVHYRHVERGRPRIEAICDRFVVAAECRDLALLALAECERVHRVSEVRAGPVAAMLERLGAFDDPVQFARLITLCTCDYFAYGDRPGEAYGKAALLEAALAACAEIDAAELVDDTGAADDALRTARAEAIALAFRSQRWSDDAS